MGDSSQPSRNPASSSGDVSGALREILGKFLNSSIDDMIPAKIVAFDRELNRATIQPMIVMIRTDGDPVRRNQLASIPVFNIGGGGAIMSFSLKPGDLGWIKATDRDIAEFLKNYTESAPSTRRVHDFNNGLFIPDVMTGYVIDDEDVDNAVLQTLDGLVRVSLFPDKLKLTAPEIINNTPLTIFTGDVQIDGDLNNDGKATLGGSGGAEIARKGDAVAGGVITVGSSNHTAT